MSLLIMNTDLLKHFHTGSLEIAKF